MLQNLCESSPQCHITQAKVHLNVAEPERELTSISQNPGESPPHCLRTQARAHLNVTEPEREVTSMSQNLSESPSQFRRTLARVHLNVTELWQAPTSMSQNSAGVHLNVTEPELHFLFPPNCSCKVSAPLLVQNLIKHFAYSAGPRSPMRLCTSATLHLCISASLHV